MRHQTWLGAATNVGVYSLPMFAMLARGRPMQAQVELFCATWRSVSCHSWTWTASAIRFEVEAEGLYEASVLGLCALRKHELQPGGLTELEVEVRSSVMHTLTVTKVREWLQRGVRTPKEAVLKERD